MFGVKIRKIFISHLDSSDTNIFEGTNSYLCLLHP